MLELTDRSRQCPGALPIGKPNSPRLLGLDDLTVPVPRFLGVAPAGRPYILICSTHPPSFCNTAPPGVYKISHSEATYRSHACPHPAVINRHAREGSVVGAGLCMDGRQGVASLSTDIVRSLPRRQLRKEQHQPMDQGRYIRCGGHLRTFANVSYQNAKVTQRGFLRTDRHPLKKS